VKLIRFAALLPGVLAASCAWFGPQAALSVKMPEVPRQWRQAFPDLSFDVVFQDSAGSWQTVLVTESCGETVIDCWKGCNSPVLAYPRAARSAGLLRPAGGLYPRDCVDNGGCAALALSWEGGCLAMIFKLLAERGLDASFVNAERLALLLARHADPWTLDLAGIAESLARSDFSAYDVDLLPARDVQIGPGVGEWFLESPFSRTYAVSASESIVFPGLSVGMHSLFSVQGQIILIWVGEKETVIAAR
jgi:hypothetical protein